MTDREIIKKIYNTVNISEIQDLLKELEKNIDKQHKNFIHRMNIIEKAFDIKDEIIILLEEKVDEQKEEIESLREELEPYILKNNPNISTPNEYGIGMENYEDEDLEEIEKLKKEYENLFKKELDL